MLNCAFFDSINREHAISFYIYEESVKAAVAQPDPSLKPRAAHTHSESSARGGITREGQQRHKSPDSHRGYPRSTALYGPEGFWCFFPHRSFKKLHGLQRNLLYVNIMLRLDGTGLLQTSN